MIGKLHYEEISIKCLGTNWNVKRRVEGLSFKKESNKDPWKGAPLLHNAKTSKGFSIFASEPSDGKLQTFVKNGLYTFTAWLQHKYSSVGSHSCSTSALNTVQKRRHVHRHSVWTRRWKWWQTVEDVVLRFGLCGWCRKYSLQKGGDPYMTQWKTVMNKYKIQYTVKKKKGVGWVSKTRKGLTCITYNFPSGKSQLGSGLSGAFVKCVYCISHFSMLYPTHNKFGRFSFHMKLYDEINYNYSGEPWPWLLNAHVQLLTAWVLFTKLADHRQNSQQVFDLSIDQ